MGNKTSKKNYTVKVKRKLRQRTDYKARLKLIASRKTRFTVRKMLNNINIQLINFESNGDKTIVTVNSRELVKLGWKAHRGSIPAAYLTGLVAGLKAKKAGIKEAVLDIGLTKAVVGSSLFAAAKGGIDAGLKIPCSEEVFPKKEAIEGKLIENYAKTLLNEDKQRYNKQFSRYIQAGLKPEELSKHFEEIKRKVLSKWQ